MACGGGCEAAGEVLGGTGPEVGRGMLRASQAIAGNPEAEAVPRSAPVAAERTWPGVC